MMSQPSQNQQHLSKLKQKLVPNFINLESEVQNQIVNALKVLLSYPDKKSLQNLSRLSILQQAPILHSHLWKLLLETIPRDYNLWEKTIQSNHELYVTLVDKFLGKYIDEEDLLELSVKDIDQSLWGQIQLDTKRTHSALNFFQKQIKHTKIYLQRATKNHDIMSRILYIWGKINPTVRYVQGMNQILAPLYYLQFQMFNQYSESEVFFMFASVMTFVIDMHIKQMDESAEGIMGKMKTLDQFLKVVDYTLWDRLNSLGIMPHYYSFRWLALLLAQQFGILQTMKLWDQLLAFDGYKRYFLLYCFCIAILKLKKSVIMQGDFIVILPAIQKIRGMDVSKVIQTGTKIYQKYSKVNIEKLSLQIQQQRKAKQEIKDKKNSQEKNQKQQSWKYTDVMKSTVNYFSKWMPSKK